MRHRSYDGIPSDALPVGSLSKWLEQPASASPFPNSSALPDLICKAA